MYTLCYECEGDTTYLCSVTKKRSTIFCRNASHRYALCVLLCMCITSERIITILGYTWEDGQQICYGHDIRKLTFCFQNDWWPYFFNFLLLKLCSSENFTREGWNQFRHKTNAFLPLPDVKLYHCDASICPFLTIIVAHSTLSFYILTRISHFLFHLSYLSFSLYICNHSPSFLLNFPHTFKKSFLFA